MIRSLQNPVLVRELQQAARLTRTPFILSIVTIISGLLICAIGGVTSAASPAAEVGTILYQAFFSLAFALVAWVGPGVAALTIVGERAGRTWEPLVLTGMSPRTVAHGKLLAALSYIGLYVAALAPVGALPFLFGGVTATEVLLGYVLLGLFSVIAVGFGLAVSSGAATPAMALLVTLPLSVAGSLVTYFGMGVGGSFLAHEAWPVLPQAMPVWLPTAYARAELGSTYLITLVLLPLGVTWILAALFREVTVANLSDPSDDRSTGLKRWFVITCVVLTVIGSLPPWLSPKDAWVFALFAQGTGAILSTFALFVLSADPIGPSRRVLCAWDRERAGPIKRFFGPGLARTALLLLAGTAGVQLVLCVGARFATGSSLGGGRHSESTAVFAAYTTCFFAFLCGLAVFIRSLRIGRLPPRAVLALALFAAVAGPLFALAIAGITSSSVDKSFWIAAPSPLYVFAIIDELGVSSTRDAALSAGITAMLGWAALGVFLGAVGYERLKRLRTAETENWAQLTARLQAEDATREAGAPAE